MNKKLNYNYILIFLSLVCLFVAWFVPFESEYFTIGFYLLSYLLVGAKILYRVGLNFIHKNFFDENTLMGIASVGALCLGEFREAIFVVLLYTIGTMLQSRAVNKSRKSIADLMDIQAKYANVLENNEIVTKDVYDVKKEDILLIKAGEKVAVDAIITDGESGFDTSAITGESVPKYATVGDAIISGSINVGGVVYAKATTDYYDSTASKVLELVEEATSKKSKCENFITKFAKYYTPAVCLISLLIFFIPVIIGLDTLEWLKKALIFLVVSCPCALVISVPLSFFGGIGGLSRRGILIKGSNYLEALSKTKIVIFDKTGTLTNGKFRVSKIVPNNISEEDFIKYIYNIEKYSNHILGKTIVEHFSLNEVESIEIDEIKESAGYGISGLVNGLELCAGSERMLNDKNIDFEKTNEVGTTIYLSLNGDYLGCVVLEDEIKENVKQTIGELKNLNVDKIVVLSGDKAELVNEVGSKIGADLSFGDLLPNEKVDKVNDFINQYHSKKNGKVVFVGDGINDAPALALSDIGVSMGSIGTDSAKEASDVVLMTDNIENVARGIKGAKKTMRIIWTNIVFALLIKVAILGLDIFGLATMWLAVFADVGVTILAILNSLRTLKQ